MKKFYRVFIGLACLLFIFSNCEHKGHSLIVDDESYEQIASSYISNMLKVTELLAPTPTRSLEKIYPEFLEIEYEIEEGGNFNALSNDEKELFFKRWQDDYEQQLLEKFSENDELVKMIKLENDVLKLTLYDASRSITSITEEDFLKLAYKNFEYLTKSTARAASPPATENSHYRIRKDCLVQESVTIFKENYKKGRIIVSGGPGSSSLLEGSSFGHSSMMAFDTWSDGWDNNGLARTTITSYPQRTKPHKNVYWDGKIDGVQLEPLGMWAGDDTGSVKITCIYDVQKKIARKKYEPAPTEDYIKAADYAMAQIGKPYNWNFGSKGSEEKFYCSSLVYKSWQRISEQYNMSNRGLIWVTPGHIAASDRTLLITRFQNY